MRIENIRLSHACNSSSSHTILLLKDPNNPPKDDDCEDFHFGWQYFTAASENVKKGYLFSILERNLARYIGRESQSVAKSLFAKDGKKYSEGYIDHESMIDLPPSWDGKFLDMAFYEDFKEFLLRRDVVVLGGNDNDTLSHPLVNTGISKEFDFGANIGELVAKREGVHWTLYNRVTGSKIRLTFDETAPVLKFSTSPELVDIKITNVCTAGCAFCYAGSTPTGVHADPVYLSQLLRTLGQGKCFEVAFGGGEPLKSPSLIKYAELAKCQGTTPNLTTRAVTSLSVGNKRLFSAVGKVAISVTTPAELCTALKLLPTWVGAKKLAVQVIDGVVTENDFRGILQICVKQHLLCTLLGFKKTGRANSYPCVDTHWFDVYSKVKPYRFAVDTSLLQQYPEVITEKFAPATYNVKEGAFSCFVDAVEQKMGPSSYCDPSEYIPLPDPDKVIEVFAANAERWSSK